jgi:hypothetical protein
MSAERVVPIGLAEMAVEVQAIKGDFRLLQSTNEQALAILQTAMNNVQAEQERAREDRMRQISLLQSLNDRAATFGTSSDRVRLIEDKLNFWRGVVVGFGILATTIAGISTFWIKSEFANAAEARAQLVKRIEQSERRP